MNLGSSTSKIYASSDRIHIKNLTLTGSAPAGYLFQDLGNPYFGGTLTLDNSDLSGVDYIFESNYASNSPLNFKAVKCKLKAGATIAALGNSHYAKAQAYACLDGADSYVYTARSRYGNVDTERTVVRTGGASDEAGYSFKVVASEYSSYLVPLEFDWDCTKHNAATGSALTATIEINSAAGGLTNEDIWFELEYLGDATSPKGSTVSCRKGLLATAAAHASSSASWPSGTAQKMTVTFTPQLTGFVTARVYVAKASSTIYIDPKITLAAA
jgi:hypothetical protein